jgi:hypothetical protein
MRRILGALWLVGIAACSSDAVLATDMECAESVHCPKSSYCQKLACGDAVGFCKQRPTACTEEEVIVCGCDGVSYANDCVRAECSTAASTPGSCAGWEGPPKTGAACFQPKTHYR